MGEHNLVITLIVPFALFCVGVIGKTLVRGPGGFAREDLYLGSEALLVALTAGLTYSIDVHFKSNEAHAQIKAARDEKRPDSVIAGLEKRGEDLNQNGLYALIFVVIALVFYLLLLKFDQEWKDRTTQTAPSPKWWQFWSRKGVMLGFVSNFIGFGLLVCFLYAIKLFA